MNPSADERRTYHHGSLRRTILDAALAEIEARGISALSMREIARRAGVSHAAPTHHFTDKTGVFTALATEGFTLITEAVTPATTGDNGFVAGGLAYVAFALTHRGYFDVMFRPDLLDGENPDLISARNAAFDVLYGSARAAMAGHGRTPVTEDEVAALVVAGWSSAHGFATLWLNANLHDKLPADPDQFTRMMVNGLITLGGLAQNGSELGPLASNTADDAAGVRSQR